MCHIQINRSQQTIFLYQNINCNWHENGGHTQYRFKLKFTIQNWFRSVTTDTAPSSTSELKIEKSIVERNSRVSFLGSEDLCRFWFKRFEKNRDYKQTEKYISLQKYWYSQNCLPPFAIPGF